MQTWNMLSQFGATGLIESLNGSHPKGRNAFSDTSFWVPPILTLDTDLSCKLSQFMWRQGHQTGLHSWIWCSLWSTSLSSPCATVLLQSAISYFCLGLPLLGLVCMDPFDSFQSYAKWEQKMSWNDWAWFPQSKLSGLRLQNSLR